MPGSWLEDFVPFTLLHILSVSACAALIVIACLIGRRLCHTLHERRFRLAWGCFALAFIAARNIYYFRPAKYDPAVSLPLHICDLAVAAAALAMLWPIRAWRTLLYFWGLGLSVQAFLTPTLQFGVAYPQFWMFWIGHTIIVGSAVYDLLIGRYRPTTRDLLFALAVTSAYGVAIALLDRALGLNYGFLGPTTPSNPTVIDNLGPWPGRIGVIFLLCAAEFSALWAVWPAAGRLRGRHVAPPAGPSAPT
jgi:hypothetical integral membrane protein (TIGR02206 family)